MEYATNVLLALLLTTDLVLVTSSRLFHCIKTAAAQGLILGILPLLALQTEPYPWELIVLAFINIAVKGLLLPGLLGRSVKKVGVKREIEPYVGYSASAVIMILIMLVSFGVAAKIDIPASGILSSLALPTAFSTMAGGLFLIISRKKAITQAIGFLIFENGITIFGMALMIHHALVVELGILLDVLVLVFVMGIAVFHIRHEFQHIDADRLTQLGDFDEEEDAAGIAGEKMTGEKQ